LVYSVAVDTIGDVVVAANLVGSVDFGTGPVQAQGNTASIVVAKYDCMGTPMWTKLFGMPLSPSGDVPFAITTDALNAILITGYFTDSIDFGCGALQGDVGTTGFILKLDASGACVWSKRFGGLNGGGITNEGQGIAVDSANSVLVAGLFRGTNNFGGGPIMSTGNGDLFVLKLDAAGNFGWVKDFGAIGGLVPARMTMDAGGNLILCGMNENASLNFGGGPLSQSSMFLAKLDPTGGYIWAESVGNMNAPTYCYGLATDGSGRSLVGGEYFGSPNFGGGPLSPGPAVFVAGFSPAGAFLFSHAGLPTMGMLPDVGAVAVNKNGNGLFVGDFVTTINLAGPALMTTGGRDMFVLELDPTGTFVSSKQFGGAPNTATAGTAAAVSPSGMLVVGGYYGGAVDFGSGPLPAAGGGYIAQMGP
jgi:hypothetical protein